MKFLVGLAAFAAMLVSAAPALATEESVCDNLDTGHLSTGDATSITITAPEGKLIVRVCVKAGSAEQGDGPEYTDYNPGVTSVTISHSTGKELSHYSVQYGDVPPPPPVDVCPNIPGNQETVPPGFALIEGECRLIQITPFCAPPAVLIDGFCVFTPPPGGGGGGSGGNPPTLPICPPGMVATNGLDGEPGNDVCEFPPGPAPFVPPVVTVTPAATTPVTTPAQPVANPKPVVKPKPKPERKPVAKAKPKPKTQVKKPKAAKPFKQPDGCPAGKAKYKGKCVTGIPGNG